MRSQYDCLVRVVDVGFEESLLVDWGPVYEVDLGEYGDRVPYGRVERLFGDDDDWLDSFEVLCSERDYEVVNRSMDSAHDNVVDDLS